MKLRDFMYMQMNIKISNEKLLNIGLLFLSISVLVIFMSTGISGNDFWWHIKVGEYICEQGVVPLNDIFSWYGVENNISWTAHEWLSEVLLFKVFSYGGEVGIYLLCLFAAVGLNFLVWLEVKKYLPDKLICGSFFLITFAATSSLFFYGRPQIFGFFFTYIEVKILYAFITDNKSKGIYFLPLLAVLWSNMYGGSSNLSYILCLLFLVSSLFNFKLGKIIGTRLEKKALLTLLIVTFFIIGALLINPIGYNVLTYPYTNLSDSISMTMISEWQSPDAKLIGNVILFFLPMGLSLLGFIHTEDNISFVDFVMMSAFSFLFLRSIRFIMLWYIIAAFACFKYLPKGLNINTNSSKSKLLFSTFAVISIIPLFIGFISVRECCVKGSLISTVLEEKTVTSVKKTNPKRLFNDYNLGEALIYNDIPVFFDSRADLYSKCGVLSEGLELMSMQPITSELNGEEIDVEKIISKYQFDYILIEKQRPLYTYLCSHPSNYQLLFDDDSVGYFEVRGERDCEY